MGHKGRKCKHDKYCKHKPYDNYEDLLSCCADPNKPVFYVNVEQYHAIKHHDGYGKLKGKKYEEGGVCCRPDGACKKKSCDRCCRKFKGKCC